ncbi:thioredoxin family protein [Tenacibaculum dicentrarchi]|nr:thioredoxin family protein [Tenacibaculum dicentrarchi]MCD8406727.1 thioredoxin family protein [Tenacibaculum dicentrarchi]MCD8414291.1 thioredoxin family protein [Tenacibaculum dicentrarchi]MCD8419071.1 thioredoxin family protein [Tenacibaculum dicentrarchi]MCD8424077.1 thioredoxin family protein [Tenacibaculum dicentrarchi]
MKKIIENSLEKSISYTEYRTFVKELLVAKKSTGNNQSDDLLNFSLLNDKRMKRLDKTIKISEKTIAKLKDVKEPQTWLVLTEGWCGDAAQNLPVINKIAEENSNIQLKVVLRDDNEVLMNAFLTNGGKAIPKLIALDKKNEVIGTWGPRPSIATKMVADYKAEHGALDAEFKESLQVWYNKNKGINLQDDITSLFE